PSPDLPPVTCPSSATTTSPWPTASTRPSPPSAWTATRWVAGPAAPCWPPSAALRPPPAPCPSPRAPHRSRPSWWSGPARPLWIARSPPPASRLPSRKGPQQPGSGSRLLRGQRPRVGVVAGRLPDRRFGALLGGGTGAGGLVVEEGGDQAAQDHGHGEAVGLAPLLEAVVLVGGEAHGDALPGGAGLGAERRQGDLPAGTL